MKLNKLIIPTIALLFVIVGCDEDLLNVQNPNQPTVETFWQDGKDAEKAINAVYAALTVEGMYARMGRVIANARADDVQDDASPWFELSDMARFNVNPSHAAPAWHWRDAYQGVFRANQVLTYVPDIPDEEIEEGLRERVLGEAHFLRAFNYYHLVRNFRNIPLILEVPEGEEDYYVPQAPPEDVWQQIISDFSAAVDMLPPSYTGNDVGRATSYAAMAYLAKTYMSIENKDWEQADQLLNEIITTGPFRLVDNYRDNFTSENENNEESIFELQFSRDAGGTEIPWAGEPGPNWGQTHGGSGTFGPEGFGFSDFVPSRALFEKFQEEQTVNGNPDPRLYATMFYNREGMTVYGVPYEEQYGEGTDRIFWRKYMRDQPGTTETDERSGINLRLMRYAEVLMLYAETRNELGDQATAASYIQQVRDRANLPDREAEYAALSQQEMRDVIAEERFLEFAKEDKRWYDLLRWGWLDDPERMEQLRQNDSELNALQVNGGRKYLPIPQGELDTNPELEQNDGYQ